MYPQDETLLEDITITRNLAPRTTLLYRQIIERYTDYHKKPLTDLLDEAEMEEEQGIRWKKRRLRKRLLTFRQYLYENYMGSTAKMNFSKILTIYKHYEIEVMKLPPISEKQTSKSVVSFKDLPTKEIIRKALIVTNQVHRALILFQISTGCSIKDCLDLHCYDLLDSVRDYYTGDSVVEMVSVLKDRKDVVPCFQLTRRKTGKVYYTFCTNEAFRELCLYLLKRKALSSFDRLFKITQLHAMQLFREVNDLLGLGKDRSNGFVMFRSHMLRKFHASMLYNSGMSMDLVNELQGKGKSRTDSSYFMEDPNVLRSVYLEHCGVLTVFDDNSVDGSLDSDYVDLVERVRLLECVIRENLSGVELGVIGKYVDD